MKRKLDYKSFEYKDISSNDLVDYIDKIRPITLKNNKELINKIHKRYPFIPKYKVALIVQAAFYIMRGLLIKNKVIYLGTFISTMYMKLSKRHTDHQGWYPLLKVSTNTPQKIKRKYNV